jgi:hypothetical protein
MKTPLNSWFFHFTGLLLCAFSIAAAEKARELDAEPIDLTPFYGKVSGTEGDSWFAHPDWEGVPKGLQNFGGILFDVSGTMLLRSKKMPHLKERHGNIPVNGKHRYIHVLHGIGYADPDGVEVAKMVLRYANGEERSLPIVYGAHLRDWWQWPAERISTVSHPDSAVAWTGPHPSGGGLMLRLFRTSFANPLPETPIATIDFVSMNQDSVLCIVALSVGDEKPEGSSEKK